jgi:hypothetical protein
MRSVLLRLGLAALLVGAASSAVPAQTPATSRVMRAKLLHAQRALGALMTNDYGVLQDESRELVASTRAAGWNVLNNDRYARYSETFRRAAEDLADAAKRRQGDDAMRSYVSMTLACYSCHRYLDESRIAR